MLNENVDAYIGRLKKWKDEISLLRDLALKSGAVEDYKWMHPCYTIDGKNVFLINEFKDCCAINFFKGEFIQDEAGILKPPTEKIQTARIIRFTAMDQVEALADKISGFMEQAIAIERAGLKSEKREPMAIVYTDEMEKAFAADVELGAGFAMLTPGRQRAYILHFAEPKQEATRFARIEKCKPRIMMGKGLLDCVCGHTKRKPGCDGSHKHYVNN
jgi:uncharacterized protein YdeI (YjbR/CyaY-like superfamily)